MAVGSERGGTAGGDLQICTVASSGEQCTGLPETAFAPGRAVLPETALLAHSQIDPRQGLIGWTENLCEIHD